MKLKKILIASFVLTASISFGQGQAENDELHCKRMKYLAQQARLEKKDFKESSIYMLKAEKSCGGLTKTEMAILIGSLRNTIMDTEDTAISGPYTDTLIAAWNRAEKLGLYDSADDLIRAFYLTQGEKPNNVKADSLFQAGIKVQGTATQEHYISYYYYNLYVLYSITEGDTQNAYKKRLIKDYFSLLKLIREAKMSLSAEENLNNYLDALIQTADDLLPELDNFLLNVPEDNESAVNSIKNFISLLEKKKGTSTDQYESLVKLWDDLDPSIETKMAKAKLLMSKGKYSEAKKTFEEIITMTDDVELQQEASYSIAYCLFKTGSYKASYNEAMNVGGTFEGKGFSLAGQCVAQNAENCGVTTLERQANYYYAVELLEKAKAKGESVGNIISSYKKQFPSKDILFKNGNPSSVTLECYGVTVNVVN